MHKYLKYKSIYLTLLEKTTAITDFDTHRCLSSMNSYIGYLGHFKAVRQVADICEWSRYNFFYIWKLKVENAAHAQAQAQTQTQTQTQTPPCPLKGGGTI